MNTTIANINTASVIEAVDSAIIAAEKFNAERQNAFRYRRISFECDSKLDVFFSIRFLKDIKAGDELGCVTFASFFDEECNSIDLACEMYADQIESNPALADALNKYADALNSLKNLYNVD